MFDYYIKSRIAYYLKVEKNIEIHKLELGESTSGSFFNNWEFRLDIHYSKLDRTSDCKSVSNLE